MPNEINGGLTRREVLKKGAKLGGTLLWVAPMVQAVRMSPAMAQIVSTASTECCLNLEILATKGDNNPDDEDPSENDITVSFGATNPAGTAQGTGCTVEPITNVMVYLFERKDAGTWGYIASFNGGRVDPATAAGTLVERSDRPPGTYYYRSYATYKCPSTGAKGMSTPYYQWPDSVTIP
jgi:hypothetical protein